MSQSLYEKHFLALQTEVIAIKNACGPGVLKKVNDCYPSKNEWPPKPSPLGCSDDIILNYEQDIQSFFQPIVSSSSSSSYTYQNHSYRASAYQVVYNIAEIFLKHIKSRQDNDEFDVAKITENLMALKRYSQNPSKKGNASKSQTESQSTAHDSDDISYFSIGNDVGMYLLAKRFYRCLKLNSNNSIIECKFFRNVIKNIEEEIKMYENSSKCQKLPEKYQLFNSDNEISKEEILTYAEQRFAYIYELREQLSKDITTNKLMIFFAIRLLSILSMIAGITVFYVMLGINLPSIVMAFLLIPSVLFLTLHLFNLTYLPLSISASAIKKNTEHYNELKSAIQREFGSDVQMKTPEELIHDRSLKSGPCKGDEHYWLSFVTPSCIFS